MAGPSAVPDIQKYTLSEETKSALKTRQFDIWQWDPDKIIFLLEEMYIDLGLMDEFKIPEETMKRFLLRVKNSYRDVPFHNFRHCFCVTQMMYVLIHGCELSTVFTKLELMILITTCICHDLDHPGLDNYYQINAKTEIAQRYKDLSPLENHHCSVMFNILSNPDTNIFINLSQDQFIQARAEMMILILGTDMSRHADIVANFIQRIEKFSVRNEEDRQSLKMNLVKACDISNECRPWMVAQKWVKVLHEEYFEQSAAESRQGLPSSKMMDKNVNIMESQTKFIEFVLLPLFQALNQLYPQMKELAVEPLNIAKQYYEHQIYIQQIHQHHH